MQMAGEVVEVEMVLLGREEEVVELEETPAVVAEAVVVVVVVGMTANWTQTISPMARLEQAALIPELGFIL